MKARTPPVRGFAWQNGYGAFSVGADQLSMLKEYIERQAKHHAEMTFEEELRGLLRRHGVAFDERYVWD